MRLLLLTLAVLGVGCSSKTATPDARPACTKALYDPCAQEHDCTSNVCQNYPTAGIQVCTQACTPTNACPPQNGVAVACDTTTGACAPAMANACILGP